MNCSTKTHGYASVEFRKEDIEKEIPVESNSADLVLSNRVINMTINKESVFREIHRILKKGGRMVISDLVTDIEISMDAIDEGRQCGCIDGAFTKLHYLTRIKQSGFSDAEVLSESMYQDETGMDGRKTHKHCYKSDQVRIGAT